MSFKFQKKEAPGTLSNLKFHHKLKQSEKINSKNPKKNPRKLKKDGKLNLRELL